MILHPLQNTALLTNALFIQRRPRLTQGFGENPSFYLPLGLTAHNGADFGSSGDDRIFAPFGGVAMVKDDGKSGYGLHVKIRDEEKEITLAHLDRCYIKNGDKVYMGDKVGLMGNSGISTGKHLHVTLRFLEKAGLSVWEYKIRNYNNGYKGAVDPLPYLITWKGTMLTADHDNLTII